LPSRRLSFERGRAGTVRQIGPSEVMTVEFHGVRGSTPCCGDEITRYGGNTSSVSVSALGQDPVLFDLGTGVRYYGLGCPAEPAFRGSCLLSHLHWDHMQGLPFFSPLLQPGAELDVYAPSQASGRTVADVMTDTIRPPLFPITLADLPGEIRFHDVADSEFSIGEIDVVSRLIPHIGRTCGYRVTWHGRSVSYLSDHQQPHDGSFDVTPGAMELCEDVDILIHDAQYTPAEFEMKRDWGHCMIEYAIWLAGEAKARTLVLFHHDPSHDDDRLDALAGAAAECGRARGIEVVAAYEGLRLNVGS
jgi:phosphoribosyl 1,2-cyclic phosphodiesterase